MMQILFHARDGIFQDGKYDNAPILVTEHVQSRQQKICLIKFLYSYFRKNIYMICFNGHEILEYCEVAQVLPTKCIWDRHCNQPF